MTDPFGADDRDPVAVLDDPAGLEAADPGEMLRAVASGAAQVREAATLAGEVGVARIGEGALPRSVVVCGMGGSGIAGDVLAAVAGPGARVPVLVHRAHGLPAWVGAADLVVAVSCSGATEETLSALEEAVRRGCDLLVVGASGSPVESLASRGRAVFVPVDARGRQPRASVWSLSTPLLVAGHVLGLCEAPAGVLEETALRLEAVAARCRVDADTVVNPAKSLALELLGAWPVVWGTSPLTGVAAYRAACQLNENAEVPASWGVLPEAAHNQVVALDGPFGGGSGARDLFADPDDGPAPTRQRLVLLRDPDEHPQVARRAEVVVELAEERGVPVTQLLAEGASPLERLASLLGTVDFATTYLALAQGNDPTPVHAISALKSRVAR